MPPLKTYIFECISDAQIEITIQTYGTETEAFNRLSYHVKEPNNFRLNK